MDRWKRIADNVGTRTEDQCIKRHAELKGRASASVAALPKVAPSVSSGISAVKTPGAGVGSPVAGSSVRKDKKDGLAKMPVQEFAKFVKEQQVAKAEVCLVCLLVCVSVL